MLLESAILLLIILTILALYHKDWRGAIYAFVLSLCVFVVYAHVLLVRRRSYFESFSNSSSSSPTVENPYATFEQKLLEGAQNYISSTNTEKSTSTHNKHTESDQIVVDEALQSIGNGLTVYASTFQKRFYSGTDSTWKNIMPAPRSCHDPSMMHFRFETMPSFTFQSGLFLGGNSAVGPPSYMLGFSGDTSFTMFMVVQFKSFDTNSSAPQIDIVRIYANTQTSNALKMYVIKADPPIGTMYNLKLGIQYGATNVFTCSLNSTSDYIPINTSSLYTFVVMKNFQELRVIMYDSSDMATAQEILKKTVIVEPEPVRLSNREMTLNPTKQLQASIFNIGFYNKALTDVELVTLNTHIKENILLLDDDHNKYTTTISNLEKTLSDLRSCPYDATACGKCSTVTDWSHQNALYNASTSCLLGIADYCSRNIKDSNCICWDSTHPEYNQSCKNIRSLYAHPDTILDINQLSTEQVQKIAEKYSICPKASEPTTAPQSPLPPPIIVADDSDNQHSKNTTTEISSLPVPDFNINNPYEKKSTFETVNVPSDTSSTLVENIMKRPSFFKWIVGKT